MHIDVLRFGNQAHQRSSQSNRTLQRPTRRAAAPFQGSLGGYVGAGTRFGALDAAAGHGKQSGNHVLHYECPY